MALWMQGWHIPSGPNAMLTAQPLSRPRLITPFSLAIRLSAIAAAALGLVMV